jgi:hypothetical protein
MTGGIVASTLVNETIVNNANGFGVNNLGGTPVLWNSIVYNNNVGADLSGFVFGPPMAGIPTVNYTDFCGLPWPAGTTCGTLPPGGPVAGCIDLAPDFVLPAAPNFVLRCASSGTTCPNGCALPCASPCVDAGEANGPGSPKMPVVDADGFDRTVSLNQPCPPPDRPDMGATEKRTCTP